jgi:Histidine kinase-, DNA gyrase B-, and HSP90-like ATPase
MGWWSRITPTRWHRQCFGDRTQLQQVFVNLTVNAIQARAHTETTRRTLVIRTTLSDPHTLCRTLEDNGLDIKPEHLDHLFDSWQERKSAMAAEAANSRITAARGPLRPLLSWRLRVLTGVGVSTRGAGSGSVGGLLWTAGCRLLRLRHGCRRSLGPIQATLTRPAPRRALLPRSSASR